MPSSVAYVADISPPNYRGRYMGMYHVTFSLAFAMGPWIGALLFDQFGGTVVWRTALCAGGLSSALLWQVGGRPQQPLAAAPSTQTLQAQSQARHSCSPD